MKIKVTEQHIKDGSKACPDYCPVALAIKEVLPDSKIRVGNPTLIIDEVKHYLPRYILTWIARFDRGLLVQPMEFELCLSE